MQRARLSVARSTRPFADRPKEEGRKMVNHLWKVGEFVRRLRAPAPFGSLSRASLKLLRLELRGQVAECDWVARSADKWDKQLKSEVAARNVSEQALRDAIAVREILFRAIPDLKRALLRVYRQKQAKEQEMELIITGTVSRDEKPPLAVRSLAMRAKLFGFQFWLDEGMLESLQSDDYAVAG
jgi:hypothetical protein